MKPGFLFVKTTQKPGFCGENYGYLSGATKKPGFLVLGRVKKPGFLSAYHSYL